MTVPDPRDRPWLTVPEAGELVAGLGRSASYEAARRGELPILAIGRKRVVPTARLLAMLGLGADFSAELAAEGEGMTANGASVVPLHAERGGG